MNAFKWYGAGNSSLDISCQICLFIKRLSRHISDSSNTGLSSCVFCLNFTIPRKLEALFGLALRLCRVPCEQLVSPMRQRDNINSLFAVQMNRRILIRSFLSRLCFLFIVLRSLLDDKSIRGTVQRRVLKEKIISKQLFT